MNSHDFTKNRFYIQFAGFFLVFGIIVAIITSFINYNLKYSDIEKELSLKAHSESEFRRQYLSNYISRVELMLQSIALNDITSDFISSDSQHDRKRLTDLFFRLYTQTATLCGFAILTQTVWRLSA